MKIYIAQELTCIHTYEPSYIISELKLNFEITENLKEADVIVFPGSCAGSLYHLIQSANYINRILSEKKPDAVTFLTGCMTRKVTNPEADFIKEILNKIDFVIPQDDPNLLFKILAPEKYKNANKNLYGRFWTDYGFVTIFLDEGCLNNCSFCEKTYLDFPLRSFNFELLKKAIDYYNSKGFTRIVFRGTNVSQYGLDTHKTYMLPKLIEYIEEKADNINDVKLVGFAFKDAILGNFAKTLADSSKVSILSGGLESGSDRLLGLMQKGFTSDEFINFVQKVNKKKSLHLNIIAGFPTENSDDVNATLEVLRKIREYIDLVTIVKYMDSPFVASHKYPQLENEEIEEHAKTYQKVLNEYGICDGVFGNLLKH